MVFKKYVNYRKMNLILAVVLLCPICSCTSSKVEYVGREKRTEMMTHTAVTANELSYKTKQFLAINNLKDDYEKAPEKVIVELVNDVKHPDKDAVVNSQGTRFTLFVLMELCVNQARFGKKENALKYWASACFYSYKYIFDNSVKPSLDRYYAKLGLFSALHFYNVSLSQITDYLVKHRDIWGHNPEFETVEGKIVFTKLKSDLLWPPQSFEKYINTLDYLPVDFLAHSFDSGIGVPMIGIKDPNSSFEKDKEFTLIKRSYPFVFVLKFEDLNFKNGVVEAEPEVYGAYKNEYIKINNFRVPLYKDYSILIAKALESKKHIQGIEYMFDPGKMGKLQELYFLTPFNPDKIPVVLVHGLMSEPRTWSEAMNLLLSNRQLRENYQFIFYSYPTGLPSILTASQFREDLSKLIKKYDPDNKNPKMNYTVVIGHSMGGLLTNLVTKNSKGRYLLNKYFGEDVDETDLTESQRALINSVFVFKALPFIRRIILIGTPHRGAEMATYFYSKIGAWLTSIPASLNHEVIGIMKGLKKSPKNKDIEALKVPSGIEDLAPGGKLKQYVLELPYGKNTTIYSIIGDKDEAGKKGGTDGVVAYHSSHLDEAKREIIIKSGHDEIKKAACVKEIMKILLENLDEYNSKYGEKKIEKQSQDDKGLKKW